MPKKVCAVTNCGFSAAGNSFYSFRNRRPDVIEKWLTFCDEHKTWDENEIRNSKICSSHFVAGDFINPTVKSRGLRTFAIPTVKYEEHQHLIPSSAIEYTMEVEIDSEEVTLNNNGLFQNPQTHDLGEHDYAITHVKYEVLLAMMLEYKAGQEKYRNLYKKEKKISGRKSESIKRWKHKHAQLKLKLKKQERINKRPKMNPTSFLAEQLKNNKRKPKGVRYSAETKNIALGLQYCSSKGYQQFQQVLKLPSISLLKKWINNVDIKEGINENLIELLQLNSKHLTTQQKVVTLSIDEISLQQHISFLEKSKPDEVIGFPSKIGDGTREISGGAKSALVVMIRRMDNGFKQAIAFYFSKSGFKATELVKIVHGAIEAVNRSGFITKLLVCDQNATNRSLFKLLNVSIETPYFTFRNDKIFAMFDPPHLLKSARNNLYHHNAVYMGALIKWDHIQEFYEADIKRNPRAVPNLHKNHVVLQPFGEMRVGPAKTVLSGKMASGLKTYADLKVIPKECVHTADYCKDMDNIFDIFDTTNDVMKKELRRPIRVNSKHWKTLDVIERRLKKLRFVPKECKSLKEESNMVKLKKHSRVPYFIEGWLLNINCIRQLFADLQGYGFSSLITKYLTQDALENFFGLIRMKGNNNRHPDPLMFRSSYRQVLMSQMLKLFSVDTNCEPDDSATIVRPEDFSRIRIFSKKKVDNDAANLDEIFCSEGGEIFDSAQVTNVHYSSNWILSSIHHQPCIDKVQGDSVISSKVRKLADSRAVKSSASDITAGKICLEYLTFVVSTFKDYFSVFLKQSNLGIREKLLTLIMNSKKGSNLFCNACERQVLEKYLNMLIRTELRRMNEEFKQAAKRNRNSTVSRKAFNLNIVA